MGGRGQGYVRALEGKGRWEVVVSAGVDPLTGKRRRVSRVVHGRKDDANRALRALQDEVDRTHTRLGSDSSLGALITEYLRVTQLSPTMREDYLRAKRQMLPDLMAELPLWKLRANDLDSLYASLRAQGWSPDRVIRLHTLISAALSRAVKWSWLVRNVAADASAPTPPRRRVRPPQQDAVGLLLEKADPVFAVFLRLAFVTGARRGELCGLQWGDLEAGAPEQRQGHARDGLMSPGSRLWFKRAVVYTPTSGVIIKGTKTDRERVVTLDSDTAGILEGHRTEEASQLRGPITPTTFVFTSHPYGREPWRPDYATFLFGKLRKELGLTGVRLHDLRHASASYALRAGIEMSVVSKRLGHSRQSTTSDVYSHVLEGRDAAAADALAGMVRTKSPLGT